MLSTQKVRIVGHKTCICEKRTRFSLFIEQDISDKK